MNWFEVEEISTYARAYNKRMNSGVCMFCDLSRASWTITGWAWHQKSEALMQAFLRFAGRRGQCELVLNDNGTNFAGAARELHEAYDSWQNPQLMHDINVVGTLWGFITPAAPQQGGLWLQSNQWNINYMQFTSVNNFLKNLINFSLIFMLKHYVVGFYQHTRCFIREHQFNLLFVWILLPNIIFRHSLRNDSSNTKSRPHSNRLGWFRLGTRSSAISSATCSSASASKSP